MTVKQLSEALLLLKESLQDKKVKVLAPNGEMFEGEIKFVLKDPYDLSLTEENVDYIHLKW